MCEMILYSIRYMLDAACSGCQYLADVAQFRDEN